MTVEVVARVGDPVHIPAIETDGVVISIVMAIVAIQYEVAYWFEGKRQTAHLFDWEFHPNKR